MIERKTVAGWNKQRYPTLIVTHAHLVPPDRAERTDRLARPGLIRALAARGTHACGRHRAMAKFTNISKNKHESRMSNEKNQRKHRCFKERNQRKQRYATAPMPTNAANDPAAHKLQLRAPKFD